MAHTEIFVSEEPEIPKWKRQDAEIIEAVGLWGEGLVTDEELLADAVCRVYRMRPRGIAEGPMVDVPGSLDVYVRLYDDGVLTPTMYDGILAAIGESWEPELPQA